MAKPQRISQEDVAELNNGFKFCTWDLETTGLNASYGRILCCAIKPMGQKAEVYRIDGYPLYKTEPWNDSRLITDIRDRLEQFNVGITYNGYRFDVPMLNSRLTKYKQRVISPTLKHLDLINVTRHRLLLGGNSLESLLAHLQAATRKTPLDPEMWARAAAGDKTALDYIVEHNIHDVDALEEGFNQLIPYLDIQFKLVR